MIHMRAHTQAPLATAVILLAAAAGLHADLTKVQAEPNLERRSKLALENAGSALQAAREAYRDGDNDKTTARIAEVQESVELAYKSLQQTNKDPRRSPKWFKSAEMATRDLLRRIDSFQQDMSFSDRSMLDKVKEKTQQVHDDLLLGLMEGKKR